MENKKIQLMLMSLGGTTAPLIKSIQAYQPDKIIFFASHDSVPLSHEILAALEKKPGCEFFITDNPNSLFICYTRTRECIDRAEKSGVPAHEIMVDYTGGTKVMTAALLLAALGRSYHFNYVGGGLRNKNGLGTVVNGAEQMFSEASPWAVFAEEERRQVGSLFNCRRFSAVIDIIGNFNRQTPPKISDYFGFILPLAQGFLLWDQFSHKAAQRNIEKGMAALEKYIQTYQAGNLESFLESLQVCKTHLDEVVTKTDSSSKFDRSLVKDLINNARRKMADKRFDDAAARIYRSLELYGQIVFKQVSKCDNSKVKLDVIPDLLKEAFKQKYYDPYTKHLKLPLSATFEYLRAMGHEAGARFYKMEKEIKNIQSNRNLSILAHGVSPVSESGAESILNTVSTFVGETDFFDFPKLP
ncbi:MAG: TIGR02710 family CRISPR-associated protein [Desulfobacterium sp.]|nr:TIGR02710 family CRISPR-associated protein [Desulfobacterium sp.]